MSDPRDGVPGGVPVVAPRGVRGPVLGILSPRDVDALIVAAGGIPRPLRCGCGASEDDGAELGVVEFSRGSRFAFGVLCAPCAKRRRVELIEPPPRPDAVAPPAPEAPPRPGPARCGVDRAAYLLSLNWQRKRECR